MHAKHASSITAIVAVAITALAHAADPKECARLTDDQERLSCYDRLHGEPITPDAERVGSAQKQSETGDRVDANDRSDTRAPSAAAAEAAAAAETNASATASGMQSVSPRAAEPTPAPAGGTITTTPASTLPSEQPTPTTEPPPEPIEQAAPPAKTRPGAVAATGTITDIEKLWPSLRYRYTLDNGESWVQTKAAVTSIDVGDRVEIRRRRLTHFLISEGGISFSVERIE